MRPHRVVATMLVAAGMTVAIVGCGDDEPTPPTPEALVTALLALEDVSFIPAEWEENTRAVVQQPTPPWENTLDPYLCSEAGTPMVLTLPQAQLELTGGNLMEILIPSKDAEGLFSELEAAYGACGSDSSLPYTTLEGVPAVGDRSASFRSSLGVATIARFGSTVMVLKWQVGDFYDQPDAAGYYVDLVTAAAEKVDDI